MAEGFPPSTRLRVADELFGTRNLVSSPLAMENCRQLMMAFWVDWLMVSVEPALPMVALPATTAPPVGFPNIGLVWPKNNSSNMPDAETTLHGLKHSTLFLKATRFMGGRWVAGRLGCFYEQGQSRTRNC